MNGDDFINLGTKRNKKSAHTVTVNVLMLVGLILISIAILCHMGLTVISSQQKMMQVLELHDELSDFISSLKDAETGQRGYLLTGKSYYLEPCRKVQGLIENQLNDLKLSALRGELEIKGVERIIGLTHQKMAELQQTIELRNAGKSAAALAIVETDYGKNTMDKIRSEVRNLQTQTQDQFLQAKHTAEAANNNRTIVFVALGVVNLLALGIGYKRITHEITLQEKQKELLSITLASIGEGVILTGPQGEVTFLNQEAIRLTGWSNPDAQGRPLTDVFRIINEKTRQLVESPVEKVLRHGKVVGLANHTLLISKDGKEIPIDDSAAPIRHNQGPILGVVLVFRDFTQHKLDEQALRHSNQELEQFAYVASHDLQEPLRTISIYVDLLLLRSGAVLDSNSKTYLDFIKRGALYGQELTRSLLKYADIGTKNYPFKSADLNTILEEAISNLKASIEENKAEITYDPLPTLSVNEIQIKQLFQNLISNGIKYKDKNHPQIHISARPDQQHWFFSIKDNGIGIEPKDQERIFTIFKRVHSKSDYAGIGIGLAVCKKIVNRHGGNIWVESIPHKGSVFCFTLSNFIS